MQARVLLVDFDGVIRSWAGLAAEFSSIPVKQICRVAFADELLNLAITGQISDEEWRRRVAEALALEFGDCAFDAVAAWSESAGENDAEVLTCLQASRFRDDLVLITNGTSRLNQDLARLGLADTFRRVVNSSDIGTAKPDEAIFRHALDAAGCTAGEALFVDDRVENVDAAVRYGIQGHLFESVNDLIKFLEDA